MATMIEAGAGPSKYSSSGGKISGGYYYTYDKSKKKYVKTEYKYSSSKGYYIPTSSSSGGSSGGTTTKTPTVSVSYSSSGVPQTNSTPQYYNINGAYFSGTPGSLKAVNDQNTINQLKSGAIKSTAGGQELLFAGGTSGSSSGGTSGGNELQNLSIAMAQQPGGLGKAYEGGPGDIGQNEPGYVAPTAQITQADIDAGKFAPGGAYDYMGQQGIPSNGASSPELQNLSIGMAQDPGSFQQTAQDQGQTDAPMNVVDATTEAPVIDPTTGQMMGSPDVGAFSAPAVPSRTGTDASGQPIPEFVNLQGAYFRNTAQGLAAENRPEILDGLRNGTIPSTTMKGLPTEGNAFSSFVSDTGLVAPPSQQTLANHQATLNWLGSTYTPQMYAQQPIKTLGDYVTEVMDALGMGEASVLIQDEADELEKLENKKDEELRNIDDDPWLTEGVRLRQRRKVEEKYQDEIGNREAKLQRLQRDKELMVQQAQWAMGTAISLWDSDRRFDQAQAQMLYNQRQDALEWQYKQAVFDQGVAQYQTDLEFKQFQADRDFALSQAGLSLQEQALGVNWYNAYTSRMNAETAALEASKPNGLDATSIRQYTEKVDAADRLIDLATEYRSIVQENGMTFAGPGGDKALAGKINTLRAEMTAAYKQAETLGTLDEGVLTLVNSLLGDSPVTWKPITFGGPQARILGSIDTLLEDLYSQSNLYRGKLGLDPITNAQYDTTAWTSPSGNTYSLPFDPNQFNSQTSTSAVQ